MYHFSENGPSQVDTICKKIRYDRRCFIGCYTVSRRDLKVLHSIQCLSKQSWHLSYGLSLWVPHMPKNQCQLHGSWSDHASTWTVAKCPSHALWIYPFMWYGQLFHLSFMQSSSSTHLLNPNRSFVCAMSSNPSGRGPRLRYTPP